MPFMLAAVPAAMAASSVAAAGGIAAMSTGALIGTIGSGILGTVSALGTIASSNAARAQGQAQQVAADYTANQMRINAGQEQASGQRAAIAQEKQTALVESNARAAAAGQGSATTDTGVETDLTQIATEGSYRSLTAMYNGDAKAQALNNQANGVQFQGAIDKQAGNTRADTALISGASSLFQKYASPGAFSGAVDGLKTGSAYTLNKMGFGNTAYDMLDTA